MDGSCMSFPGAVNLYNIYTFGIVPFTRHAQRMVNRTRLNFESSSFLLPLVQTDGM